MFVVQLRFSTNKSRASELMQDHNEWIQRGFADDVFLMLGTIQPKLGGAIIAYNTSLEELQNRVNDDPFVAKDVVTAEIIEITPAKTIEKLNFLLE